MQMYEGIVNVRLLQFTRVTHFQGRCSIRNCGFVGGYPCAHVLVTPQLKWIETLLWRLSWSGRLAHTGVPLLQQPK